MEPASLAVGILGMYDICMKGYAVVSDAMNAPRDAQDAARRVRIERAVLAGWGEYFDVTQGKEHQSEKLKISLMRGLTPNGVFDALCAISETFTDVRKMKKRYGIVFEFDERGDHRVDHGIGDRIYHGRGDMACRFRFSSCTPIFGDHAYGNQSPNSPKVVQDFLTGQDEIDNLSPGAPSEQDKLKDKLRQCKAKMSLLQRCQWSLQGKDKIANLLVDLRRYNDDLVRLCSWEAQMQMNRGLPTITLPQTRNFVDLHLVADAAEAAAKDESSPMAGGRKRLAEMARFKARILTPSKVSYRLQRGWCLLDREEYSLASESGHSTLATSLKEQESVFVEWQSYGGDNEHANEVAEKQIQELSAFLSVSDRPEDFRSLDCLGLFKEPSHDRYGAVYRLPTHLRRLGKDICVATSLTDMILGNVRPLDLGIRFELAKKLMYSLVVLHSCGWLHKNISPESILFFPRIPEPGQSVVLQHRDVERPTLMGYGLSRPDDVPDAVLDNIKIRKRPDISRNFDEPEPKPSPDDEREYEQDDLRRSLIYQHPDKVASRFRRFRHSYDIYSLGLVLLEIGLWRSLQSDSDTRRQNYHKYQESVVTQLVPRLWGQCGAIYGSVVKDCLTMETDDPSPAEKSQRRLAWNLAERLDRCVA